MKLHIEEAVQDTRTAAAAAVRRGSLHAGGSVIGSNSISPSGSAEVLGVNDMMALMEAALLKPLYPAPSPPSAAFSEVGISIGAREVTPGLILADPATALPRYLGPQPFFGTAAWECLSYALKRTPIVSNLDMVLSTPRQALAEQFELVAGCLVPLPGVPGEPLMRIRTPGSADMQAVDRETVNEFGQIPGAVSGVP
jgi:hypothetical protein